MKLEMYAIEDSKSGTYLTPFFMQNADMAIRAFMGSIKNPGLMHDFPGDFNLWLLGEWNDQNGFLETCEPEQITKGHDVAKELGIL